MMKSYEIDFKEIFKCSYEYKFFSPGRVNLIGEHIDYNGGHVLPIAIDLGIYALVSFRNDKKFAFFSDNYYEEGLIVVNQDNITIGSKKSFSDYPKAVIKIMQDSGKVFDKGLNIYYYSTLPEQAGLASDACIEVLTAKILNEVYDLKLTPFEEAILTYKASKTYLQFSSGMMDQMAISLGKESHALYLDTFMLDYDYIPYNLGDYTIVICQTNKKREKISVKFKQRVRECERAFDIIKNNFNVLALAKVPTNYMEMIKNILPDDKLYKRVLHVYSEEQRVQKACEALKNGDIISFANEINASHDSLRDNFEVSCKELDTIVELARFEQGCIAARMTGAGFGGCAIALVHNDFLVEFKANMANKYYEASGLHGAFFEVNAFGGPKRLAKDSDSLADALQSLVQYSINNHLIEESDKIYCTNQLLNILHLDEIEDGEAHPEPLYMILDTIVSYATSVGLIENNQKAKDDFESELMAVFVPRPSDVEREFFLRAKKSTSNALAYFYGLSIKSNYIREDRVRKNIYFSADTKYGNLQMSINQSKVLYDEPVDEKSKFVRYPLCPLCKESVGYKGRSNYPNRQNHRIIPVKLENSPFYFQYSPWPYFNEHSILFSAYHKDQRMSRKTFEYMVSFVDQFDDYFIGTNADLPIVGGGILNHEHFHTGRYTFPVEKAKVKESVTIDDLTIETLEWPVSVIRLKSNDSAKIIQKSTKVLDAWRKYDDLEANIISVDDVPHNAITPILHKYDDEYVMDIFLRNNRTSEKYPLGIFHPHEEYFHIKKENIGLYEVMGFGVLPQRLKEEMSMLKEAIVKGDFNFEGSLEKHKEWALKISNKYQFSTDNVSNIIDSEIGEIFVSMLEDCSVFKNTEEGYKHFKKFIDKVM